MHDVYIGAKYVNDKKLEFYGYILGKDLGKIEPKNFGYGPCRHILLSDLKPYKSSLNIVRINNL